MRFSLVARRAAATRSACVLVAGADVFRFQDKETTMSKEEAWRERRRLMGLRGVLGRATCYFSDAAHHHAGNEDAARLNEIAMAIRAYDGEVSDRLSAMIGEDDG